MNLNLDGLHLGAPDRRKFYAFIYETTGQLFFYEFPKALLRNARLRYNQC